MIKLEATIALIRAQTAEDARQIGELRAMLEGSRAKAEQLDGVTLKLLHAEQTRDGALDAQTAAEGRVDEAERTLKDEQVCVI